MRRVLATLFGATPTAAPGPQWGPTINVVRATTLINDAAVARMCKAIDTQVARDFAPAHNLAPCRVVAADPRKLTKADRVIALVDDAGEGALGWHTEDAGDYVFGQVGVKPILDNHGDFLRGELSVSAVLSHEVLEMMLNPHVSSWSDTGQGYLLATEACDAVQGYSYDIDGVSVSDFILPDWFSPVVTRGDRFDHLGKLKAPFTVAPGGYTLKCQGGQIDTVYGAVPPPEWLMKRKHEIATARTRRLVDSVPG